MPRRRRNLLINRRLMPSLVDGSDPGIQTGRPHGTQHRELLATVLHELTHFYDRERVWTPEQRQLILSCGGLGLTSDQLPVKCQGQAGRSYTLSDDPRLLDLAGWQVKTRKHGNRESKNLFIARSPDLYEVTNPKEFVAVNMEDFPLDPSYACRRPAPQRYFAEDIGWSPAPTMPVPYTVIEVWT